MPDPSEIKFPGLKPAAAPGLALPRRRPATRSPFELSEASAAARESIRAIVSATRMPFNAAAAAPDSRVTELERSLRQLELKLAERERDIEEAETRARDRERDLAEAEALVAARERLLAAARRPAPVAISAEEKSALLQLRAEVERQEASILEAREAIRERERFLDESESRLFEKVQAQQEKEIELDQRAEDHAAREGRLRGREAAGDPEAAAVLRAEAAAAAQRDEFKE